jgi:hypothetical protein
MDLRSSNSVAALALLIASGGVALSAPAVPAGERLEFSTPAFPLAVPHPDVEIKEPKKVIGSEEMAPGMMGGVNMGSQQQIVSTKPKSRDIYDLNSEDGYGLDSKDKYGLGSKDKYDLNSDPLLSEGQQKRDPYSWLNAGLEPGPMSNGVSSIMPREWDEKDSNRPLLRKNDSGFEAGQNPSRYGTQAGMERDKAWDGDRNARNGERYGRDSADDKPYSFWSKTLDRDSSAADRFSTARFPTPKDEAVTFGFIANEPRKTEPLPAADSAHNTELPAAFGNFTPFDNSQTRQIGEQFGDRAGANQEFRAWEPPPPKAQPSRGSSSPVQNSWTRVVAPNRPVSLPFPKRPDSPF